MVPGARFGHVNLIADDWRALVAFYIKVFGCEVLPPERNYSGKVGSVEGAQGAVLAAGGGRAGEIVTLQTADGRRVTWCYTTDPEGNIVELQSWSEA